MPAWVTSNLNIQYWVASSSGTEARLQEIIDRQTDPWGIKVTAAEVRDVILPDSMKRAMAGQAESERERRAKIINAEAEFQVAQKLVQAALMISAQPIALQLRFFYRR